MSEQVETKPEINEQKIPKKEPKKKPDGKSKVEGLPTRPRAKTTAVEPKLSEKPSNKIIATGIGGNQFSSLLNMFDKKRQSATDVTGALNENNQPKANKLEMPRFGSVDDTNKEKQINKAEVSGLSIKERMELLKKEGEKTANKGSKSIDPVLEARIRQAEEDRVDEEDDLNLSDAESKEKVDENSVGLGDDEDEEEAVKNNDDSEINSESNQEKPEEKFETKAKDEHILLEEKVQEVLEEKNKDQENEGTKDEHNKEEIQTDHKITEVTIENRNDLINNEKEHINEEVAI